MEIDRIRTCFHAYKQLGPSSRPSPDLRANKRDQFKDPMKADSELLLTVCSHRMACREQELLAKVVRVCDLEDEREDGLGLVQLTPTLKQQVSLTGRSVFEENSPYLPASKAEATLVARLMFFEKTEA